MLMDDLQGIAGSHADLLGFGADFCRKNKIGWVMTNYAVDIIEMPTSGQEVTISTWPSGAGTLRALRDSEIRALDGRLMVRATTQWVMIDITTRRLTKIAEKLLSFNEFPPRALDTEFEKIEDFEIVAGLVNAPKTFPVLFDDIDSNGHVNNTAYTVWASESLGNEFLASHMLSKLRINFKKEIPAGTTDSITTYHIPPVCGDDNAAVSIVTRHLIKTSDQTNAAIICTWIPL